jgi:prophage antirepressor-like protein
VNKLQFLWQSPVPADKIGSMASRCILLDEEHFQVAEDRAKALGTTTDDFVSRLIDELVDRHASSG